MAAASEVGVIRRSGVAVRAGGGWGGVGVGVGRRVDFLSVALRGQEKGLTGREAGGKHKSNSLCFDTFLLAVIVLRGLHRGGGANRAASETRQAPAWVRQRSGSNCRCQHFLLITPGPFHLPLY